MATQLTPAIIGVIPRGLLAFLNLKSGGENPRSIGNNIAPTFSLLDWYVQANAVRAQIGPVAGAGVGDGDFSSVAEPVAPTRCYYVTKYTVRALVPAGTTWSVAPAIQYRVAGGTRQSILVGPPQFHSGGGAQELVMAESRAPFWMPPDSIFGFVTLRYTGAGAVPVYAAIEFIAPDL